MSKSSLLWNYAHPERMREAYKRWKEKNPYGYILHRKTRLEKMNLCPYIKSLVHAKQRCGNPKSTGYRYYGGRGIKCLLTLNEIKFIWERDKAHLMEHPSIDRIDSNGNYEFSNCRFIEMAKNRMGNRNYFANRSPILYEAK